MEMEVNLDSPTSVHIMNLVRVSERNDESCFESRSECSPRAKKPRLHEIKQNMHCTEQFFAFMTLQEGLPNSCVNMDHQHCLTVAENQSAIAQRKQASVIKAQNKSDAKKPGRKPDRHKSKVGTTLGDLNSLHSQHKLVAKQKQLARYAEMLDSICHKRRKHYLANAECKKSLMRAMYATNPNKK